MLKIAFFTEAGKKRGYGHLIRSYTIYERFSHHDTTFFLDSDINFDDTLNDIHYFTWENLTIPQEYDIIFIDSYEATLELYETLNKYSKITVYIDDYARLKYPKGVILNISADATQSLYNNNQEYYYLLGLSYLPLRKKFKEINPVQKEQIFIMLGGSDTSNLSLELITALKSIKLPKVILNNNAKIAKELAKEEGVQVLYQPDETTLINAMKESSLAITTASMSAYELAYAKIPTIIIAVAKNQDSSSMLHNHIAIDSLVMDAELSIHLQKSIQKIEKKEFCITDKIDGNGVERIYTKILELL